MASDEADGVVQFPCQVCGRTVHSFGKLEQHVNQLCLACNMVEQLPGISQQEKALLHSILFGTDFKEFF